MSREDNGGEVLLRTGIRDPVGIGLVRSLFEEAGIPYFAPDQTPIGHKDAEFVTYWTVLVPREREAEAREIVASVEAEQ